MLFDLTRNQVLTFARVRRIDIAHPVGFGGVEAVDVVVGVLSVVDSPEILSVGIFRDIVFVIDLSHQGTKTCASWYVIRTPNAKYLSAIIRLRY